VEWMERLGAFKRESYQLFQRMFPEPRLISDEAWARSVNGWPSIFEWEGYLNVLSWYNRLFYFTNNIRVARKN
jgi:hypothetical protein